MTLSILSSIITEKLITRTLSVLIIHEINIIDCFAALNWSCEQFVQRFFRYISHWSSKNTNIFMPLIDLSGILIIFERTWWLVYECSFQSCVQLIKYVRRQRSFIRQVIIITVIFQISVFYISVLSFTHIKRWMDGNLYFYMFRLIFQMRNI